VSSVDVRAQADVLRIYSADECGADGYPPEWHATIKHAVRAEAGHRCVRCHHPYRNGKHGDGSVSICDEQCDHDGPWVIDGVTYQTLARRPQWPYTTRHRIYATWRILTVHHLNGNKADCRWFNLAPLCQRCHLSVQGRVVMERAFFLEHSDWMKPHAAGFYADKYLGETLTREQASARQDELLALERLV